MSESAPSSMSRVPWPWLAGALVLGLVAFLWYDSRVSVSGLRDDVARRVTALERQLGDSRSALQDAEQTARDVAAKLTVMEERFAKAQSEQLALETLYRELAASRDDALVEEVGQLATIAAQQLQLAGDVRAALAALQAADARLARTERPQFIPLRRAIGKDIERLKAVPLVDTVGVSLRLAELNQQLDRLPLLLEPSRRGLASDTAAAVPRRGGMQRLLDSITGVWRDAIRIERYDQPVTVISPDQAFFLRQNLRLRLLDARLALLQREQILFRADLSAVADALQQHFDSKRPDTQAALAALRDMQRLSLNVDLPSLSESLSAVQGYRADRGSGIR